MNTFKPVVEQLEDRLAPNTLLDLGAFVSPLEFDLLVSNPPGHIITSAFAETTETANPGRSTLRGLAVSQEPNQSSVPLRGAHALMPLPRLLRFAEDPAGVLANALLSRKPREDPPIQTESWQDGKYLVENYPNAPYQFLGFDFSGQYINPVFYQIPGSPFQWVTSVVPSHPTAPSQCMSANFRARLSAAFPAWSFQCSPTSLSDNSLVVKTYEAIGTPGFVGADFHVSYVPHAGDPLNNIHWIQVIITNHGTGPGQGHGPMVSYVDNGGAPVPYYDDVGAADPTGFADKPRRLDADMTHVWDAELYLVEETAPQTVRVWGGVLWGWRNTNS